MLWGLFLLGFFNNKYFENLGPLINKPSFLTRGLPHRFVSSVVLDLDGWIVILWTSIRWKIEGFGGLCHWARSSFEVKPYSDKWELLRSHQWDLNLVLSFAGTALFDYSFNDVWLLLTSFRASINDFVPWINRMYTILIYSIVLLLGKHRIQMYIITRPCTSLLGLLTMTFSCGPPSNIEEPC